MVVEVGVVEIHWVIIDRIIFTLEFDTDLYFRALSKGEAVDGLIRSFLEVDLFLEGEKRIFEGLQLIATQF